MIVKYSGHAITGVNVNLYPIDGINYEETSEAILDGFTDQYEEQIREKLAALDIKLEEITWFAPAYYNYQGDDLTISVSYDNLDKYKAYLIANEEGINALLATNKSCDGYIATTVEHIAEEIDRMQKRKDSHHLDTLVVNYILKDIDFDSFDVGEYFEYEYCAECGDSSINCLLELVGDILLCPSCIEQIDED